MLAGCSVDPSKIQELKSIIFIKQKRNSKNNPTIFLKSNSMEEQNHFKSTEINLKIAQIAEIM